MFLLVLACHGITMVTGHKQENVRLAPGESHVFGENCRIDLVDVTFSDNPDFLTMNKKKRHQMMTRENFHPKQNFAKIALSQNGRQEGLQNVFFLTPLKHRVPESYSRRLYTKGDQRPENGRGQPGHHPKFFYRFLFYRLCTNDYCTGMFYCHHLEAQNTGHLK